MRALIGVRPAADLAGEIDALRIAAAAAGMLPAATVAHALTGAIARGSGAAALGKGLDLLDQAIGCDGQDRAARDAFAAACSVSFGR